MSITEQEPTAPRCWSAFVCPECRFIFRLPGDHEEEGIACPSCRRMLRIPFDGEKSAPLLAPLQKIGFAENNETFPRDEKRARSKRKKKSKEVESPAWDTVAVTRRSSRNKGKYTLNTLKIIAGWTFTFAVMLGASFIFVKIGLPDEPTDLGGQVDDFDKLTQVPMLLPDEELETPIELPKIMQRNEAEFLSIAQSMAEAFLSAATVGQILPLVRDVERVKAQILAHYPDGKIEPTGLSKFNATGLVSYKDSYAAVSILTPDLVMKHLAFVDGADGLKIDWESWVGWSEMPWDKLIESRPSSPVLVRARLKWVDYYNFGFDDESKWRSYHLVAPDGEHTLYGYAERNSLFDQRLRPGEKNTSIAVTLKIRFPEDGESRNQALIEEYVADGWVIPEKSE